MDREDPIDQVTRDGSGIDLNPVIHVQHQTSISYNRVPLQPGYIARGYFLRPCRCPLFGPSNLELS